MITKNTLLSGLPIQINLIAHCYACARTSPVDRKKYHEWTVHQVSEEMNCPTCKSGNLAIRPVLKQKHFNLRSLFRLLKPKRKIRF